MMARMAGKAGTPAMQPFAPNDYATGLLGAFALGLALFHRGQTGQGQRVPKVQLGKPHRQNQKAKPL